MASFRLLTFGCKANQFDSALMAEALVGAGFSPAPPEAAPEVLVVNTCTVTARADQQARQALRRLARQFPQSRLWVTGCYAQRDPEALAALPGVAGVFGNPEKPRVAEFLQNARPSGLTRIEVRDFRPQEPFPPLQVSHFPGQARAWLKVQEGCSHGCTYCIVPRVRGPSRSLPLEAARASFQRLAGAGYREIVLTGVDLGQYGRDLPRPSSLAELLLALAGLDFAGRLRLSSLEPEELTPELLEVLAALPFLCPHFHLPLQSGSRPVLQAMGRPYGPEYLQELVAELRRRFPTLALGADFLVGFPGETAADFEATYRLAETLPLTYFHVFPFSPRPGTAAAELPPVPAPEVRRRAAALRALGLRKKKAFLEAQVGHTGQVVVEGPLPDRPGWLRGLSATYLRCLFPGPPEWRRRLLKVRFLRAAADHLLGEPLSPPEPFP